MKACVNGSLVNEKNEAISVLDSGLLYGYGLFESMPSINGRVFMLKRHLERLRGAADVIHIPIPWKDSEIEGMIQDTLKGNNLKDAYVRLTLTMGPGEPRLKFPREMKPTIIVLTRNLPTDTHEKQCGGVKLAVSREYTVYSRDVRSKIKSINYLVNALAKREAQDRGVEDVILLNEEGFLAECSTANIFRVEGERLLTPSVESGILPGVTREVVIDLAGRLGIEVEEGNIALKELSSAEEVFKTSSIAGIVPVIEVDETKVGDGRPGKLTVRLLEEYKRRVEGECR